MEKVIVKPQAGDSLIVEKYLTGFNRKGQPVMANGRGHKTEIAAVYEDGRVRSKEGDVFEVALRNGATKRKTKEGTRFLPAQWNTVA